MCHLAHLKIDKWPKQMLIKIGLVVLLAVSSYLGIQELREFLERVNILGLGNNLLIFLFVNLTIILLCGLIIIIGRNLVKVVYDWRYSVLGSKLKVKLVFTLSLLVLIPGGMSLIVTNSIISDMLDNLVGKDALKFRKNAIKLAKLTFSESASNLASDLDPYLAKFANGSRSRSKGQDISGQSNLERTRKLAERVWQIDPDSHIPRELTRIGVKKSELKKLLKQSQVIDDSALSVAKHQNLIVYRKAGNVALVTWRKIPRDIYSAYHLLAAGYQEFTEVRLFRNPIRTGYFITFAILLLVIVFATLWVSLYLARYITTPVSELITATDEVAKGNYDIKIEDPNRRDEFTQLFQAFNKMTADLKSSSQTLENERLLLKAVLKHLDIGIITCTPNFAVINFNDTAASILPSLSEYQAISDELLRTLHEMRELSQTTTSKHLKLEYSASASDVVLTLARIVLTEELLYLIIIDDVSELLRVQQIIAWREVARRIAHEIKNPLTPIQLSAQRIKKLIAKNEPANDKILDSTEVVLDNAKLIGKLADEFSRFTRMPQLELRSDSLKRLLVDVIEEVSQNYPDVLLSGTADPKMPDLIFDYTALRMAIMNLIENSIEACEGSDISLRIAIGIKYDRKRKQVTIELADSGPGIPDELKAKIFNPYFTTKKSGTGLGLAIVTSIINDHKGNIRVYDNPEKGCKFVMTLNLETGK